MSDRLIWIWLSLACGAGSRVYNRLFAEFDTLREIYEAPRERFAEIAGVNDKIADALSDKDMSAAERVLSVCIKKNWGVLTYGDKGYPKRLKALLDPPVVLYYKGRYIDLNDNVCIAVVGTRRMTEYGERQAYRLAYTMAAGGAVIISGMALGCDAMAANGALDAGAPTVAVLGCGLDIVYPQQHTTLAEHIYRSGMIMTEYPPATPPEGSHFPVRNRIISGLSQGTVVIEAPAGSGALITAKTALLQGRDLFAVPGEVGSDNSYGCNALIKSGANVATSAVDILGLYEFIYPHRIMLSSATEAERMISDDALQMSAKRRKIASRAPLGANDKKSSSELKAEYKNDIKTQNGAAKNSSQTYSFSEQRRQREIAAAKVASQPKPVPETKAPSDSKMISDVPITGAERAVLDAIGDGAVTPDELISAGLSSAEIMSALTILEILGHITAVPGGRYTKCK